MHTKLTVLQRHVSGDLKEILSSALDATDKHLKAAEKLMKELDDAAIDNDKSVARDNR